MSSIRFVANGVGVLLVFPPNFLSNTQLKEWQLCLRDARVAWLAARPNINFN
jgi:hypothetical protein